jgi:cytochrome c oxidase subunit 2
MPTRLTGATVRTGVLTGIVAVACAWASAAPFGQEQAATQRQFDVVARKFSFTPARIEVVQDDLVKVTLRSDDIAHSFTIDGYRIAKRVGAGQTVTFEFRADQPGTFPIYCNLKQDDGCKKMKGELIVKPR